MIDIYCICHAQTTPLALRKYGVDLPLNDIGTAQAQSVGDSIPFQPRMILSGNEIAAKQTAQLLFPYAFHGDTSLIFNDFFYGDLTGEFESKALNKDLSSNTIALRTLHGGDDPWVRGENALAYLIGLEEVCKEGAIAIITSNRTMQSLLCAALFGAIDDVIFSDNFAFSSCEHMRFRMEDGTIQRISLPAHIQMDDAAVMAEVPIQIVRQTSLEHNK